MSAPELGPCIEWHRTRNQKPGFDYGRRWNPTTRRVELAHRMAYEEANGPIPAGLLVLHRCDNPPCVNPDHLYVGTQKQNMRDRDERTGRPSPIGERNGQAKVTTADVAAIRQRRAAGETLASIAAAFGLGASQVSRITRGQSRKVA